MLRAQVPVALETPARQQGPGGAEPARGTVRQYTKVVSRWGVEWSVADTSDPAAVRAAITPKT
ncbi:hypothetical protein ABZ372_46375, partial [Streptomyces sp. NPDC005921]